LLILSFSCLSSSEPLTFTPCTILD
jgi:hypothetical protein